MNNKPSPFPLRDSYGQTWDNAEPKPTLKPVTRRVQPPQDMQGERWYISLLLWIILLGGIGLVVEIFA